MWVSSDKQGADLAPGNGIERIEAGCTFLRLSHALDQVVQSFLPWRLADSASAVTRRARTGRVAPGALEHMKTLQTSSRHPLSDLITLLPCNTAVKLPRFSWLWFGPADSSPSLQ